MRINKPIDIKSLMKYKKQQNKPIKPNINPESSK